MEQLRADPSGTPGGSHQALVSQDPITMFLLSMSSEVDIHKMLGVPGTIVGGDYEGWHVRVDDDSANTGGYLILVWSEISSPAFDDWVESLDALNRYFEERNWLVSWDV